MEVVVVTHLNKHAILMNLDYYVIRYIIRYKPTTSKIVKCND